MGLISHNKIYKWKFINESVPRIKRLGIMQFVDSFNLAKNIYSLLKWGDEVEYMFLTLDPKTKSARVLLHGEKIMHKLKRFKESFKNLFHPEFASYQIEGVPMEPYVGLLSSLFLVQTNMRDRRSVIQSQLGLNEFVLTLTSFPRLGCNEFSDPYFLPAPGNAKLGSLYIPDDTLFKSHPKFLSLAHNIRLRKGKKVYSNVPIYRDINTPDPFIENFVGLASPELLAEAYEASLPNHIYLDSMCFGAGCCCLQVTMQAYNLAEARYLYDQLACICPFMLALSAASPMYKGYLTDVDCRWSVISGCLDDRTEKELLPNQTTNDRYFRKSRYDSIDCYISYQGKPYNDMPVIYEKAHKDQLVSAGVDDLMAEHVAHLFARDHVLLYANNTETNDDRFDIFESLQSTIWQTMRFKPPHPGTGMGWRIEFRPMEIQLTDFENTAYVVFIIILTRTIISYNLNFLVPISKMEQNMAEAIKRDAARTGKFWFRTRNYRESCDIIQEEFEAETDEFAKCNSQHNNCVNNNHEVFDLTSKLVECETTKNNLVDFKMEDIREKIEYKYTLPQLIENDDQWELLTINEIMHGKNDFPGLILMIKCYINDMEVDIETKTLLYKYLKLIEQRASGEALTIAQWMRNFVINHLDYNHDSVITEKVNYDLMKVCTNITHNSISCPYLSSNP